MNQNKVFDKFFGWGDKVTKGDPVRKAQFDYYLLWIMFLAFFSIFISNIMSFIQTVQISFLGSLKYLGWAGVMTAIMWFQYSALKQSREVMKIIKKTTFKNSKGETEVKEEEIKEDSVEDMLEEFK